MELNDITYKINGAAYEVNKVLGAGFLEKVYEVLVCVSPCGSAANYMRFL